VSFEGAKELNSLNRGLALGRGAKEKDRGFKIAHDKRRGKHSSFRELIAFGELQNTKPRIGRLSTK